MPWPPRVRRVCNQVRSGGVQYNRAVSRAPETKATILDVARQAGVSRTTVSRVLNEPDRVSQGTLKRVQDATEALRYSPNSVARGLRSGRTGVIALLVGDVAQPFHGRLAQSVATAAEEVGLGVMLYDLGHSAARLETVLGKLPRQGVDGVIIATADDISTDSISDSIRECRAQGIVMVTGVEQSVEGVTSVRSDLRGVSQLAVQALTDEGVRHPALLLGDRNGAIGRQLAEGASGAMVVEVGYTFEDVAEAVGSLDHEYDALVVATLPMALGARASLMKADRHLPIVLCEEVPFAAQVTPAFTTVGIHPDESGREMVRLVDAQIGERDIERKLLTAVLTRRDSF